MFALARSALLSGVTVVAASAIAVAPAVQAPPPIRESAPAVQLSVFGPGTIVNTTVDVITEVAVDVVNLYYPVRDIGQAGINVANAIVFNPYIQVWPVTAIMSQVNMAWYLGVGIGNVTVPFIDDIIRVPQRILDGQPSIQPVIASGYNLLNTSIPLVINYGLDQLQFFTGIYIIRLPVPFFPPAPGVLAADEQIPLRTEAVENLADTDTLETTEVKDAVDTKVDTKVVTKVDDTKAVAPQPSVTKTEVTPEEPKGLAEPTPEKVTEKVLEKKPTATTNGIVPAQGEVREATTTKVKADDPADARKDVKDTKDIADVKGAKDPEPVKADPEPVKADPTDNGTKDAAKDTDKGDDKGDAQAK